MRNLVSALLVLGLALGVACGGDDDPSVGDGGGAAPAPTTDPSGGSGGGGATLQDACTLLSEEQVNAALGDDEVAATNSEPPTAANSLCQWEGSNTGNRYLHLTLRTAQTGTSVFESNYRTAADGVAVPGVGDEAFALPGVDTGNDYRFLTAAALTSSLYIQVNIAGPSRSDEEAVAVLTAVLEQVVSNLQ